jgi:UPF0271 protein
LNIDLGELPNEPLDLYALAHRVNIACGGHAGDAASMRAACLHAAETGALVGAHPSYDDRANFGRVALQVPTDQLRESIRSQCAALLLAAEEAGVEVVHAKPHGALYHEANKHPDVARAVIEGIVAALGSIAIVGPPDGQLQAVAGANGLPFLAEGFADRLYLDNGQLAPRGTPGALLETTEAAARQAGVLTASGRFQTLCVHSDTPNAVAIARAVRAILDAD